MFVYQLFVMAGRPLVRAFSRVAAGCWCGRGSESRAAGEALPREAVPLPPEGPGLFPGGHGIAPGRSNEKGEPFVEGFALIIDGGGTENRTPVHDSSLIGISRLSRWFGFGRVARSDTLAAS